MTNLVTRIKKVEAKLVVPEPVMPELVIVFVSPDSNFIKPGCFVSLEEQKAFQDWRIANLKTEFKGPGFMTFELEEEDIAKHLPLFRSEKSTNSAN